MYKAERQKIRIHTYVLKCVQATCVVNVVTWLQKSYIWNSSEILTRSAFSLLQ